MGKKSRRFAVVLCLLLAAFWIAVPVLATETEQPTPYTSSGSGGVISFPEPPAPPTPTPEPTPLPTPDPTPVPTPEPTPEPTPVPQDPSEDDPDENGGGSNGNGGEPGNRPGGTVIASTPTPAPSPGGTPGPTQNPTATARPSQSGGRPSGSLPSSAPGPADSDGSRYVTFARLNQRTNSVALTLFYGGSGCVLLGLAGIASLVVLFLRGRRQDEREAILLEIENAENRQARPRPVGNRAPMLYSVPSQNAHGSSQPRQTARSSGGGLPEINQLRRVPPTAQTPQPAELPAAGAPPKKPEPNGPLVPTAASMYTEEFALSEAAQPVKKPAAPQAAIPQSAKKTAAPQSGEPPKAPRSAEAKPSEIPAAKAESKPPEPLAPRTKPPEAKAPAKPVESKTAGQKTGKPVPQVPKAPAKKAAGPVAPSKPEPDFSATAKTTIFPAQKPDKLPEEKMQAPAEKTKARPKQPAQVPGQLSLLGEPPEKQ